MRLIQAVLISAGLSLTSASWGNNLVVFGDSLSDNGLAWERTQATGSAVPPSPPYWQGRFSNGPVAVEVMANQMGNVLQDFAWGGAKSDRDNILNSDGSLANTGVMAQIEQYLSGSPTIVADTQFVLWAGLNDVFVNKSEAGTNQVIANMAGNLNALIAGGARHVLIPLLPDLGQAPMVQDMFSTSVAAFHQASTRLNDGLTNLALQIQANQPGLDIRLFDTQSFVQNLAASRNLIVDQGCVTGGFWGVDAVCANPDQYLFWDGTHYSAVTHHALGLAMAQAAAVPEPTTVALWGLGLISLVGAGRRHQRDQAA